MRGSHKFLAGVALVALAGCSARRNAPVPPVAVAPTVQGDAAHPGATQGWVGTQLYFGLGPADHSDQGVSEAAWREFLDKEVSPRFPAGLTVLDVYGQWQGKQEHTPERLHSKLLMLYYPQTSENAARIEAIRAAWKAKTGDQSVLRVTQAADVSF